MMGITAAAGAYAYLFRGDVDPRLAAPVVLGVAFGAALSAVFGSRVRSAWLTVLLVVVLAYVAVQMTLRAVGVA
jgi:uncharacterized membrane protein YfcA